MVKSEVFSGLSPSFNGSTSPELGPPNLLTASQFVKLQPCSSQCSAAGACGWRLRRVPMGAGDWIRWGLLLSTVHAAKAGVPW